MNILITGIGGFVGSNLANTLKNRGDNVVGIIRDVLPSEWLDDALDGTTLIRGDIRNFDILKRVIGHYDIDQIYHIAASAQVKQAYKYPIEVYESNVMGVVNVLEACRQVGHDDKKVVLLNTDKTYGEKLKAIETDAYQPSEPYATSKCCQGFIAKSYAYTYDMNVKIVHSINIFGYDPFNSRLISNVVKACIRGEKPVIYTNDKSIREYVYIDDTINGLIDVMNNREDHDVYHIHTGWVANQKDIVLQIARYFNTDCEHKDEHIPHQIQEDTLDSIHWDWKPKYTFDNALKETIDKFIQYKDDWNKKE